MAEKPGRDRLFALDILRGIACCLVLVRHLPDEPDPSGGGIEYLVASVKRIGWCGVDLFFVLSGFLISSLLFKEFARHGNLRLSRFWVRRAFKIWPSYFVAYGFLVIALVVRALLTHKTSFASELLADAVPNIFFFQNYLPLVVHWPSSWSIAVEEHFYLALPLVLTALVAWRQRQGKATLPETFRGLGVFLIVVCCLVLFLRIVATACDVHWRALYFQTHFRMDALCFGVILGYVKHAYPDRFARVARAWPLLVLLILASLLLPLAYPMGESALIQTVGFTVVYLSFGALVLLAGAYPDFGSRGPRLLVLPTKGLALVGVYSYTIYLSHSIVFRLPGAATVRNLVKAPVEHLPDVALWADRLLFWGLSIVGGLLLARVVEQPFLRLRDRLFPSRGHNPDAPRQPVVPRASSRRQEIPVLAGPHSGVSTNHRAHEPVH